MARHTWHKAPTRQRDIRYTSMTAGARCLLRELDEILADDPVLVTNISRLANMVGLDRKVTREGMEAIASAGLLSVQVEERGKEGSFYTITDPARTPHQPQANPTPTPDEPQADPERAPDESAKNADCSPSSLIEEKRVEEKRREYVGVLTPTPSASKPAKEYPEAAHRLSTLLADLMETNGCKRPNVTERWLREADLLLRNCGRPPEEVEAVLRWSQASDFWKANIHSTAKFREQFDKLRLQAERSRVPATPPPIPQRDEATPAYHQPFDDERDALIPLQTELAHCWVKAGRHVGVHTALDRAKTLDREKVESELAKVREELARAAAV